MLEFLNGSAVEAFDWLTTPSPARTVLWQSTLCLGLGLVAARCTARRPGRAHALLLLSLAAAVLAPAATWACARFGWGLFDAVRGTTGAPSAALALDEPFASASAGFPWERWFLGLWALTSLFFAARVVRSLFAARGWIEARTEPAPAALVARTERIARRLGLHARPEVRRTPEIASPLIWCWSRRPRVLVPLAPDAEGGPSVRDSVLCHELAHFKRGDHWTGLGAELVRCALPWNPLVHLALRRLTALSERACDAWVLETGEDRFDYATTLLELVPQRTAPGIPAALARGQGLAKRVSGLIDGAPPSPRSGRVAVAIAAFLTLATVAGLGLAQRAAPKDGHAGRGAQPLPAEALLAAEAPVRLYPAQLDLGVTEPEVPASGTLWFVNTGAEAVRVVKVRAHCGCTTVQGLEPGALVPAGSSVALAVTMTPAAPGESKSKDVSVELEGGRVLVVPVRLRTSSA